MDYVHAFIGSLMGGSFLYNIVFTIKGYWRDWYFPEFCISSVRETSDTVFSYFTYVLCDVTVLIVIEGMLIIADYIP
jgi:hypothetical protein